jgi:hypothetical protein
MSINVPFTPRSTAHFSSQAGEVRLARGVRCRCGRELKAYDFEGGSLRIRAICQGCHQDVLTIERNFPTTS